ncbi:MAG TPA: hypothetical protein VK696_08205 [Steroidobacteraceae bacterium]|jgi:hypothetical protein|nr:hypothetical protein [Steroidobacteraceae bacterium]
MKHKLAILTGMGLAAGLVSGCGGGSEGQGAPATSATPPPPASTAMALDTQMVLAQARMSSETAAPYTVDGGALTITDTSDTSEPISVNGM